MNTKALRSPRTDERGSTMVEFALVVPIAVMLTVGMFDMGRAYFQSHVVQEAAQAGARVGTTPGSTTTTVKAAAQEVLTSADITTAQITSSNVGSSGARGSTTTVTVSLPFHTISGSMIPNWEGTFNLVHTAKLRHE